MTLLEIFDPKAPPRPVGIDLGTTHSIVARVRDGSPVVIADCDGTWLVPSAVHYTPDGEVVVGTSALSKASGDPTHTLVSVKRFMGRGASDPATKELATYKFVAPTNDDEAKSVRFDVHGKPVTPVEVSAAILRSLRMMAVDELRSVGGAVITVPAYFDDAQRQATKDAGRLAGLEVLRLLNEPTAAALAYGLEKKNNGLFAVYDLGGGTFDITILRLDDGVFAVQSTGGDSALGGDDMDRALATHLLKTIWGDDGEPPMEVVRLALDSAREIKHRLTDVEEVAVTLPVRGDKGATKEIRVSRAEFETLIEPIVKRTATACRKAMRDAEVTASDLDGIILVGGSTRVPFVRKKVAELFEQEPLSDIDPDQVVALGAALQADILAGSRELADEILLLDVLPLSLGLETMGGVVEKILPRNTTIPAGARQTFTTYADNQTGFELHILQGERELAEDCRSLAKFSLKGIPPMPAGLARLEVTFEVDENSLLHVKARELTTGKEQTVEVQPSYGLSDDEVEAMLMAAIDHGDEDLEARRLIEERVEAERVVLATTSSLRDDGDLLSAEERQSIESRLGELREAIAGKSAARIHGAIEALDASTKDWAGRKMDRAIQAAIGGQKVDDISVQVEHAKGVDAHVEEHQAGREG